MLEEALAELLLLDDFSDIYEEADALRHEKKGGDVLVRALLEFSSYCKRQCRYCGLNCTNKKLTRFRLSPEKIVSIALRAWEAGYRTIVLQSGEDPHFTADMIGEIVRRITSQCNIAVTLSCGEQPEEVYQYWHDCGAKRYLLKHETADEALYRALHPDSTLGSRVSCLKSIKRAGLETGGGFMIGLPGQTVRTIAKDLLLLKEIGCDMAGIGPFIPHPDTLLRDVPHGSAELTMRAVALARILLPEANLPATTALGVLDMEQKRSVFDCGANVIMQKVTPPDVRALYEIYPAKHGMQDITAGRKAVEQEIRRLGRNPV